MKQSGFFIGLWYFVIIAVCLTLGCCSSDIDEPAPNWYLDEDTIVSVKSRSSDSSQYSFPVTPKDAAWRTLDSHVDKVNACSIPENILTSLSTENLVKACLSYPLIIDAYAYANLSDGVSVLCKQFNGFKELLSRKDNADALVSLFKDSGPLVYRKSAIAQVEKEDSDLRFRVLLEFLNRTDVLCNLSEANETTALISAVNTDLNGTRQLKDSRTSELVPVYTPKGTPVKVFTYTVSYSDEEQAAVLRNYKSTYPDAVFLTTKFDLSYNCHSYAWYISEGNATKLCIDLTDLTILPYITDGSYVQTSTSIGKKVVYFEKKNSGLEYPTHSAVVNETGSGLTSKWGSNFLVRHSVKDCPYYNTASSIKYYKLNMSISGPTVVRGNLNTISPLCYTLEGVNPTATVSWKISSPFWIASESNSQIEVRPRGDFWLSAVHTVNGCNVNIPEISVTCDNHPIVTGIQLFQYGQMGYEYTLRVVLDSDEEVSCRWKSYDSGVVFSEIQYPDDATFLDGAYLYKVVTFPGPGRYTIGVSAAVDDSYGNEYQMTFNIN